MNSIEQCVLFLREKKLTVSTMESCTGGGFVNAITNVEGASQVVFYSAVTYSREFKIRMGVSREVIDTYTVYSIETAKEMSKCISDFTGSDYGIGITGNMKCSMLVYASIYDRKKDTYYTVTVECSDTLRSKNKEAVIDRIAQVFIAIL